jgi:hypothetical protein
MNQVKVFQLLERNGFKKEDAQEFVDQLEQNDTNLATKRDLSELKSEIVARIDSQTWRFLGGLSVLLIILKLIETHR